MASRRFDAEIDRLYQLAPDEFTAARNALAKEAGADAPAIRGLAKPPIAAWAVNQLYWKQRDLYDAMIEAAKELRQTHKAILAGRRGDLRTAGKAHEAALDAAAKGTLSLLKDNGHPATDATRQAILTTLRALPADDEPGRLSRTLQPGGFEALAGLSIGGGRVSSVPSPKEPAGTRGIRELPKPAKRRAAAGEKQTPREKAEAAKQAQRQKAETAKLVARLKAEASKARNELRDAENKARREEFDAARGAREAEKAAKRLAAAHAALLAAQQEVEDAEAEAASTESARDAAERRSQETERLLDAARARVDEIEGRLKAEG